MSNAALFLFRFTDFEIDMNHQPTVIASYVKTLTKSLIDLNIKHDTIVPLAWSSASTDSRIPLSQINTFWHSLVSLNADKSLGLKVALNIHNNSFHQLGLLAQQCKNLEEAWKMATQFYRLVSEAGTLSSEITEEHFVLTFEPCKIVPELTVQQMEGMMGAVFQYALSIMEGDFQLYSVELQHPPTSNSSLYHKVFKCPIIFNSRYYRLYIPKSELIKPIPLASESMRKLHLSVTQNKQLEYENLRRPEGDLHFKIYELLRISLPEKIPTLDECATNFHTSASTLKRKLKKSGMCYSDIINQVRKDIAFQLLNDHQLSINDIVYRTGFTCSTNFYRSFKKWSDLTPVEYRKSRAIN